MRTFANRSFDRVFPDAEKLWIKTGAEMISTVIDEATDDSPAKVVDIPFYNPLFTDTPRSVETPFVTRNSKRALGYEALYAFEIDGMRFDARLRNPYDEDRSEYEMLQATSTAWGTTINGYVNAKNARMFVDNNEPQIIIGPPEAGFGNSANISLAYCAQVEQMIINYVSAQHNLPKVLYKDGGSRGANMSLGHFAYAAEHGASIAAFDIMGHCATENIDIARLPEFAKWLATTSIGGLAVGVCLAKNKQLKDLVGTTSLRPGFVYANLTGTMRALADGEAGEMMKWVPRRAIGTDVLYGLDGLSDVDSILAHWQNHPNVKTIVVPGGTHAALLHPLAHTNSRERATVTYDEFDKAEGDVTRIDSNRIHKHATTHLLDEIAA